MRRKTRYRSAPLNFLVSMVCLSVCAGSLWLFFKDLNFSTVRSDKDKIATVTFKYRIAQRKFNDRVVWERLQQHSPLYEGDTIHTADLAQATINFNEGTSIEIGENSMLQLFTSDDGKLRLSVASGNVNIDMSDSKQEVELLLGNGMVVNLDKGSQLSAKLDESTSDVALNLKSGNAVLENNGSDGTRKRQESIKSGDALKINEKGEITKKSITVTSVSDNQKILLFDENKKGATVPIEWFPLEDESKKIVVQTSKKKDFSSILKTYNIENTNINKVEIPAEDGPVYWRAFVKGDAANSTSGKLSFESVSPVVATSPENNMDFAYFNEKPKVHLAWKGNNYSSKYKIEIAKTPDFKKPEISREVTSQMFTATNLDAGKYFWRVTPYYEENGIGWYGETETKSFEIRKLEKPQPPALSFPADGKKFTYTGAITEAVLDANFAWKGDNANADYTLQISTDENFKHVVYEKSTDTKSVHNEIQVANFPDGEYYWRILQTSKIVRSGAVTGGKEETESEKLISETRRFTIAKAVPEQNKLLFPEDEYSIESENLSALSFMWKVSKENEQLFENEATKIQFSTTSDFSRPILEKDVTDAASFKNLNLKSGKYYWRIKKGASTTDPRTIFILGKLASPEITSPKLDSSVVFGKDEKKNVTLRWKKVEEADFYKIKVLDAAGKTIKEVSETKENYLAVPLENITKAASNFTVEIQAFTVETKQTASRKSEVGKSKFSARLASPVKMLSPAQNASLDGLSSLKNGVNLSWTKGNDAYSSATVTVWRVEAGGKLTTIATFNNAKEVVNVPRLPEGNYRWTVAAKTKDGISLDAESSYNFKVLKAPDLERAILTTPEMNQKIDALYLKKNRAISFSWNEVEGATDYDFVLYQKLPDGKLKKVYSSEKQKSNQVKYKNLKTLDIGNFQWQVTATNRAKDGFIYQKGKVATGEFKIDFSLPGKIETVDTGDMYGE